MNHTKQGFTLVELMVTIAVAAILLAIGVPSLGSMYESSRATNNATKIHNIMVFARNHAVSYGVTVLACPFATTTSCGTTKDWSKGIRIYINTGGSEKLLKVIDNFHDGDKITGTVSSISFSSDGLSSGGTLTYCPNNKSTGSTAIIVNAGGIVTNGPKNTDC
ncbi:MAG: GspH/FimT family pseudopilin [Shewanella sp.]